MAGGSWLTDGRCFICRSLVNLLMHSLDPEEVMEEGERGGGRGGGGREGGRGRRGGGGGCLANESEASLLVKEGEDG